jgi:Tfp pilus assembly protein PilX
MNQQRIDGQSGFALAVVMMILLVLLILATSVLFSTATNATITGHYRVANETFAIANAGLERVINWYTLEYIPEPTSAYSITPAGIELGGKPVVLNGVLASNGTVPPSNFPKNKTVTDFVRDLSDQDVIRGEKGNGKFSVNATLVSIRSASLPFGGTESIERWQIDVRASKSDAPTTAQITALIEVGTPAFFGYAIKADEDIDIQCTKSRPDTACLIDSYDSRAGSYGFGGTMTGDPASLASNDQIRLQGDDVFVKGDADYLNSIDIISGAQLMGRKNKISSRILFNVFNANPPTPPTTNVIVDAGSGPLTIGPGIYGRIEVKAGYSLTLNGSGTYYASEVIVDGAASAIKVNPTGSPGFATLLVNGKLEVRKGGLVGMNTVPTKFVVYAKAVKLREQSQLSAALYAYTTEDVILDVVDSLKSGEVRIEKDSELFGAVVTKSFNLKDNSKVHYDISLYDKFKNKNRYRVLYWTYKNFS